MDGQDPSQQGEKAIEALSNEVKNLLTNFEGSGSGFSHQEIENVTKALGNGNSGLIAKLAEGLQQFIGYKENGNTNGLITGAGIAPSNIATHRLCDAAIACTIGVLEQVRETKKQSSVNINLEHKRLLNEILPKLHACYGKGPGGLQSVSQDIKTTLSKSRFEGSSGSGFGGFLDRMGEGFETLAKAVQSAKDDSKTVAEKVGEYLKGVFGDGTSWGKASAEEAGQQLTTLVSGKNNIYDPSKLNGKIDAVNRAIKPEVSKPNISYLKPVLESGNSAFMDTLKKRNYESYYKGINNDPINPSTHAKIFLGCLPLYYQALTYLYWRCHENGGGWNAMTPGSGPLKDFLYSMWYDPSKLHVVKRGSDIMTVLEEKFADFRIAVSQKISYPEFLKELHGNVKQKLSNAATECPLSALYYCASCYFTCKQATITTPTKSPSTIREMLYFLAALQFSSSYEGLEKHIENLLSTELDVADSGLNTPNNTLSSDQIKEHLTTSCSLSPAVLGTLQGGDGPEKSEPWLYQLFCNTAFQFRYTTGATLFSTVSNYAYALQLQLHFLYQQCSNTYTKACGWHQCTFGEKINESSKDKVVASHICSVGCTNTNHNGGDHTNGPCEHTDCGQSAGKASPLQAFLTDKLKGFSRGQPSDPSSHLGYCSGFLCHVPMGFDNHLRPGGNTQGSHISLTLKPFCGGFNTPLRQLSEKLGCLTKRTPRTLGDLFGFTWHLNGQLFGNKELTNGAMEELAKKLVEAFKSPPTNKVPKFLLEILTGLAGSAPQSHSSPSVLSSSFESLASAIPFLFELFVGEPKDSLPTKLFEMKGTAHSTTSGTHNDLYSLFNSTCSESNCGPYLYPLTHSDGATYSPAHASTYLSWVLYLSDDLQSWFQDMLDEFKNIDCTKVGCMGTKCNSHAPGTHGATSGPECQCDSVVQCGGTLPLLYRHGFRYNNPLVLMGRSNGSDVRKCSAFAQQLQKVISSK
ncbi:variant erythrocyte surface antigen-1 family protein [Babesia caballi]|uniref:Variant erythrocyte surface antigen-1 family protein n=1 Tax=Babesia caballi TaxID=5871 RepID=A0AAV4LRK3_BABCB|nr:variant erythrocyte surface antigen-1 family protein [Babesia caballi]